MAPATFKVPGGDSLGMEKGAKQVSEGRISAEGTF